MTHRETALEFLRRFAASDVEGLASLLCEDLEVEGPYLRVDSRDDYLRALRRHPPEAADIRVLSVNETVQEVEVVYEYRKAGGPLEIVQRFWFIDGRIRRSRLDFDEASGGRG